MPKTMSLEFVPIALRMVVKVGLISVVENKLDSDEVDGSVVKQAEAGKSSELQTIIRLSEGRMHLLRYVTS